MTGLAFALARFTAAKPPYQRASASRGRVIDESDGPQLADGDPPGSPTRRACRPPLLADGAECSQTSSAASSPRHRDSSPTTSPANGARASASAPAAAHGTASIIIYNINTDDPYFRAVVTGAIGDYGPAVAVYPDGKVDPERNSELELDLTRGSFRLNIAELDKKLVQAASHEPIYPATCSDHFSFTTQVPVIPGSGTRLYSGISGSFAITLTADEVQAKPCNKVLRMVRQVAILAGTGTLSG